MEQVNKRVRRAIIEEAKVSKKCSVTRSPYTDYTPEDGAKIKRYTAENSPARATRLKAQVRLRTEVEGDAEYTTVVV